ncbi:MAG: tetratricopeptide repeat protein [Candidatus Electryoneaceae bacterium]|nr:tetratricopeptide repeat protein [Candidatus Electryoneaceae bacterium]
MSKIPKPERGLTKSKGKIDPLAKRITETQSFVSQYGTFTLMGLVGILAIIAVIFYMRSSNSKAAESASFEVFLARDAYARTAYDECLLKVEAIISDYSGTPSEAVALMLKGRIHEQRGEYDDAIRVFERLINKHDDQDYLAFGSYNALGAIYYGRGEFEQSAHHYSEAAHQYPDHFNAPVSLIEAGSVLQKVNHYDLAKKMFRRVLTDYPKSRSASKARDQLAEIEFMP